mmetsp:Transcript_14948/g.44297  ORF Transcript_14948/g.44297 Transcript_14948/m.44297 type:complete len:351 (+) Transcript_14948:848-1900(+)
MDSGDLGDFELGADSVSSTHEDGVLAGVASSGEVKEPAEATEVRIAPWPACGPARRLDALDQSVASLDIHTGVLVGGHPGGCGSNVAGPKLFEDLNEPGTLEGLDLGLEGLWGLICRHRTPALEDDGPAVHLFGDEVDRAAGLPATSGDDLGVDVGVHATGKVREQRGVDVEAPVAPALAKRPRDDAHVADEEHDLNPFRLEGGGDLGVVLFPGQPLGADSHGTDSMARGAVEDGGGGLVRDHERDLGSQVSCRDGVQYGLQRSAPGRAEHGDPGGSSQGPPGNVPPEMGILEVDPCDAPVGPVQRLLKSGAPPRHRKHSTPRGHSGGPPRGVLGASMVHQCVWQGFVRL